MSFLTLTVEAQKHFHSLLAQESEYPELNLRISVSNPGTPKADVGITFCPMGEQNQTDVEVQCSEFKLYVANDSVGALQDAIIDFKQDEFGGQLTVKAPFIKGRRPEEGASLQERVQYIIDTEINPNLAAHGGFVRLEEIIQPGIVVLRFGGGCHGCAMSDVTLKNGIQQTLTRQCADIIEVRDVTDHSKGENPYVCKETK